MTDCSSGRNWSTSETEGCRLHCCLVMLLYWVPSWLLLYTVMS